MLRARRAAVLAASIALVLSACGGHDDAAHSDSTAAAASVPADATFNEADVKFAQEMIPHHEQAIEMADIALDPASLARAEVTDLASRIQGGQDPEIELMNGWLEAWGQPTMEELPDHDMSSMEGMMSAEDMDRLATLTGSEFDQAWLEMMIAHHEGAVKMAEDVKAEGKDPAVAELADAVIAAQTTEIAEMRALLGS